MFRPFLMSHGRGRGQREATAVSYYVHRTPAQSASFHLSWSQVPYPTGHRLNLSRQGPSARSDTKSYFPNFAKTLFRGLISPLGEQRKQYAKVSSGLECPTMRHQGRHPCRIYSLAAGRPLPQSKGTVPCVSECRLGMV